MILFLNNDILNLIELYKNNDTQFRPKVMKMCNYLPHFSAYIAHKELYLDFELNIEEK